MSVNQPMQGRLETGAASLYPRRGAQRLPRHPRRARYRRPVASRRRSPRRSADRRDSDGPVARRTAGVETRHRRRRTTTASDIEQHVGHDRLLTIGSAERGALLSMEGGSHGGVLLAVRVYLSAGVDDGRTGRTPGGKLAASPRAVAAGASFKVTVVVGATGSNRGAVASRGWQLEARPDYLS